MTTITESIPVPTGDSRAIAGGACLPRDPPEFHRFISGSRPLDLEGIDWEAIPSETLSGDTLRVLAYMQDVESHTVVFPRTIFSQRAVDDEIIGTFLICWLYEEGMHGRVASLRLLPVAGETAAREANSTAARPRDHGPHVRPGRHESSAG